MNVDKRGSMIMKTILYKVFSTFPYINHCLNFIRNMKKRFFILTSLLNLNFSSRSCSPRLYKNFAIIAWALNDPQTLSYRSEFFLPTRSLFLSILLIMTSLYFISPINRWLLFFDKFSLSKIPLEMAIRKIRVWLY